jgi:integrase/recombinase XerC
MENEIITINTNSEIQVIDETRLNDFFEKFFLFIDVKPKSVETYKKALKQFLSFLSLNGITQPTREDIIRFRDYLEPTHKANTIRLYLTSIKLFFTYLEQEGKYQNIAKKVKAPKITREHKKDALSIEQAKEVLNAIETTTPQGKRNKAIIALMMTTGLRTIELERAKVEDLRTISGQSVLFIQGKGRDDKSEYVKITSEVEKLLRDYLNTRKDLKNEQALFQSTSNENKGQGISTRSIRQIVKNAFRKVGLNSNRITAHSLRHTAGTLALLGGAKIEEVKQMLRHSSINTTLIYSHNLERIKNQSENIVSNFLF